MKVHSPFECPITRMTIKIPVIGPDGYTYEKDAITSWLSKHGNSPQTRCPMGVDELIPNRAMADLLSKNAHKSANRIDVEVSSTHRVRKQNPGHPLECMTTIKDEEEFNTEQQNFKDSMNSRVSLQNLAADSSLAILKSIYKKNRELTNEPNCEFRMTPVQHVDEMEKKAAVGLVHRLGTSGIKRGVIPIITFKDTSKRHMRNQTSNNPIQYKTNSRISKQTIAVAFALAMSIVYNEKYKKIVTLIDTVDHMIILVRHGNEIEKEIAACAIHRLAIHEHNRGLIGERGSIQPLLYLIRDGTTSQKSQSLAAIATLAIHNSNNKLIAQAGGIPILLQVIKKDESIQRGLAVRTLYCLAKNEISRNEILFQGGMTKNDLIEKNRTTSRDLRKLAKRLCTKNGVNLTIVETDKNMERTHVTAHRI